MLQTVLRINKLKKYGWKDKSIYAGQEWVDVPRDALGMQLTIMVITKNLRKFLEQAFVQMKCGFKLSWSTQDLKIE